ncbi:hypothetical protein GCM10012278_68850 [Nonomuraea glycinis]|uniref:Uncharacterized protein n=1 Tax=Nonomuraea glycinis TaxID=2047744 RepID=A0A918E878_9ACTN|nr:hypothetical protein GCM10012278_68850 [Nonomuraea glycinis]
MAVYCDLYPAGQRAEKTSPEERKAILEDVATQPLLDRMLRGIAALRVTGRVTWGSPVVHASDIEITGDQATLHDCQDGSGAGQADDKTGKHLTRGTGGTHLVATLHKGKDGARRVSKVEQVEQVERVEKPCSPTA